MGTKFTEYYLGWKQKTDEQDNLKDERNKCFLLKLLPYEVAAHSNALCKTPNIPQLLNPVRHNGVNHKIQEQLDAGREHFVGTAHTSLLGTSTLFKAAISWWPS